MQHNLGAAMSTMMRFPLGDFDFNDLVTPRPRLAPWFYLIFLAMIFLGMLKFSYSEIEAE